MLYKLIQKTFLQQLLKSWIALGIHYILLKQSLINTIRLCFFEAIRFVNFGTFRFSDYNQ